MFHVAALTVALFAISAAPTSDRTVTFDDENGVETTLEVTGGRVKLQWKPDFGARWAALGVDFEMFGKDHGPNMSVYDRICAVLGGRPPEGAARVDPRPQPSRFRRPSSTTPRRR